VIPGDPWRDQSTDAATTAQNTSRPRAQNVRVLPENERMAGVLLGRTPAPEVPFWDAIATAQNSAPPRVVG